LRYKPNLVRVVFLYVHPSVSIFISDYRFRTKKWLNVLQVMLSSIIWETIFFFSDFQSSKEPVEEAAVCSVFWPETTLSVLLVVPSV